MMVVNFRPKQKSTHIWKGIVWGDELLRKGLRWEVKNGRSVKFWEDDWLERGLLCVWQHPSIVEEELGCTVAHYWSGDMGWRWDMFESHLSASKLLKIAQVKLSLDTTDKDRAI